MGVIISESDGGTKKKLKKEIKKFKGGVKDGVAIELEKVMRKIRDDAVAICPKETGSLASTIRIASIPTGMMTGAWSRIKEIMLFDKSIIAGDITKINPKSGRPVDYASWVHNGHVMRDGRFWSGVPFLTEAIAMNEKELNDAINRALKKLGKNYSD